jgi:predicted glycosyl hydrolase (DUF1957 family)
METTMDRMTKDGLHISSSEIRRLENDLKKLKDKYDSMKIKQLTKQGVESDAAKQKADMNMLESLKKTIRQKEASILEIKLSLK